jgi:hypothetical protein
MVHCGKQQRRARQSLIWGNICFLVAYFLNLCTLNPLVHASALQQAAQTQHSAPQHCLPPLATSTLEPVDSQQPPEPLCCEIRGAHNKAIFPLSSSLLDSPLFVFTVLPSLVGARVEDMPQQLLAQALHSANSPPLYLSLTVLLI